MSPNALLFRSVDADNLPSAIQALESGANANAKDHSGIAPLHIAIQSGNAEMVELLLSNGANPNLQASKDSLLGNKPLTQAIFSNNPEIIGRLLKAGAYTGPQGDENPAMIIAATLGHPKSLRALIAFGVPMTERDSRGRTPAHWVCLSDNLESIDVLWSAGADFEAKNFEGLTPLESAATAGRVETVRKLIELGADTNKPDRDPKTKAPLPSELKVIDCYRLMRSHQLATQISDAMKNGPQDKAGDPLLDTEDEGLL